MCIHLYIEDLVCIIQYISLHTYTSTYVCTHVYTDLDKLINTVHTHKSRIFTYLCMYIGTYAYMQYSYVNANLLVH